MGAQQLEGRETECPMTIPDLTHDEMTRALREIDQALFYHDEWTEELNRTLLCSLSPDQRDMSKEAYRNCRFGQWLYCDGAQYVGRHPAFAEIESLHKRLHECAKDLLTTSSRHQPIPLQDYERFVGVLKQMRLELQTTKHEIEDSIYKIDPLTSASSRIGMLTRLREQQALVERELQSCCVAMLDLDHFKSVNDTYGHGMGDEVLSTFGHQIKSQLRSYDMLFRYGGEEFLVCLSNVDIDHGQKSVDRLRQCLGAIQFVKGSKSFHVTVSAGIAALDPTVTVETAIERADKALYFAKAAGRDRVCVWDATMA